MTDKKAELEHYFVKKLISVKAGIAEIALVDVLAHMVFCAYVKATEQNEK